MPNSIVILIQNNNSLLSKQNRNSHIKILEAIQQGSDSDTTDSFKALVCMM